jgi:signal transduction histidine kinase
MVVVSSNTAAGTAVVNHGADATSATMVFAMRLLLAISALLTLFIAPADLSFNTRINATIFFAYALHSAVLYLAARLHNNPFWHGRTVYWLDLAWYTLMVYFSGGNNSFFVPFFFFVILTTSFQWGFDEGARISMASAVLLTLAAIAVNPNTDPAHLLVRVTFVLALGYMIAYWGGMGIAQRRRLGLLRHVSRLFNPRFGVAQTLTSLLEQTREFYRASSCIILMREDADANWLLRSVSAQNTGKAATVSRMSAAAAAPLLAFAPQQKVIYNQPLHARLPWSGEARALTTDGGRWEPIDPGPCAQLTDLFDGRAFISAPLPLRKGEGRIYVVSADQRFTRSDATFLAQVVGQAFPVIENIALLDGMASDAAFRERQKIARDLHDTTIQPYIGLRHALTAMRNNADADNPLLADLDKLIAMSGEVIVDMRDFARNVRKDHGTSEPELMTALRRQARQIREFYGIDIELCLLPDVAISDRLAAEVFQIVNEGMSNIRKHTRARVGAVTLSSINGCLQIDIDNEHPDGVFVEFLPGSIAERAAALGGGVDITHRAGSTRVRVSIPL